MTAALAAALTALALAAGQWIREGIERRKRQQGDIRTRLEDLEVSTQPDKLQTTRRASRRRRPRRTD